MIHRTLTTVALVVMTMCIVIGLALIIIIQWIAAECGWWGLIIPSLCFTAALFGRAIIDLTREHRAARARSRKIRELLCVLHANRQAPLVEPREACRLRPILERNLRDHFEPNGKHRHQRKRLP